MTITLYIFYVFLIFITFLFMSFIRIKKHLYIYNTLSEKFTNYSLLKTQIHYYLNKQKWLNTFNVLKSFKDNQFFLKKDIIYYYLVFSYNNIKNKDLFFNEMYSEIWLEPFFSTIEQNVLQKNNYIRNDKFYMVLYIEIFWYIWFFKNEFKQRYLNTIYNLK